MKLSRGSFFTVLLLLAVPLSINALWIYVFLGSWTFDLAQPTLYATIAWLSWVPNLIICEWYLRANNRPTYS